MRIEPRSALLEEDASTTRPTRRSEKVSVQQLDPFVVDLGKDGRASIWCNCL